MIGWYFNSKCWQWWPKENAFLSLKEKCARYDLINLLYTAFCQQNVYRGNSRMRILCTKRQAYPCQPQQRLYPKSCHDEPASLSQLEHQTGWFKTTGIDHWNLCIPCCAEETIGIVIEAIATWCHWATLDLGRNDHPPCSGKHLWNV